MFASLSRPLAIYPAAVLAAGLFFGESLAQPYGPGPAGTLPGTSMSGARIVGAPTKSPGIEGARIFGDTNAERRFGKPFNDSYLRPKVVQPEAGNSAAKRAVEGRSDLNGISAGTFAHEGTTGIGRSSVTRGQSVGRRLVVPQPQGHPGRGGRAIIRR